MSWEKTLDDIRKAQGGQDTLFDLKQGRGIGRYIPDKLDRRYLSEVCSPIMMDVCRPPRGRSKYKLGALREAMSTCEWEWLGS